MLSISEAEFGRICEGIFEDRESIYRHNPIGSREETLLWMLMCCLISYLSLTEIETPCFTGKPDAETYTKAILYILKDRKSENFKPENYFNNLIKE